jgi:enoyl-CoA hydratase/carnithine racemase
MEFFQWASANSDKLRSIIKEAEQMKEDLDKMDANVAEMYAVKCKREPSQLLALMKKGGWLTAKEALDWGFVDEITDFEDDMAPVITDDMAADMSTAGIPMPEGFSRVNPSAFNRFIVALTNFFKSNQNNNEKMNTENSTKANAEEKVASPASETISADAHAKAIADKDAEIKALRDEIEALKKAPGDSTSHIVDENKKGTASLDPNSPEAFFETKARAQELYDMLP